MFGLLASNGESGAAVADSALTRGTTVVTPQSRFRLWVDGAGGYLLCLGTTVTLGGPRGDADVSLMAGLSRRHATLTRSGESWLLEAQGPTRVCGRPVEGTTHLANNYEIELGGQVNLTFRQPTVLSATAVMEPAGGALMLAPSRGAAATQSLDGVILMDGTLLLGPGADKHIACPDWEETILLYRRGDEFHCKSPADVLIDGRLAPAGNPIPPGAVVTSSEIRFRLEELI